RTALILCEPLRAPRLAGHEEPAFVLMTRELEISNGEEPIAALYQGAPSCEAFLLLAHGAGAGMTHGFLEKLSEELLERQVAVLRYQFPYMQSGRKRPDHASVLEQTVERVASWCAEHAGEFPEGPWMAGGKSMGGRMTARAEDRLPKRFERLVFVGFPLHPAKKPSRKRVPALLETKRPLLFVQGDRDALAEISLLEEVLEQIGSRATLELCEGADHSFKVLKRSGRTDEEVMAQVADAIAAYPRASRN
ncbi:MAG: alpha/beta family hydrolase, partial [Myxococcota bacterium]